MQSSEYKYPKYLHKVINECISKTPQQRAKMCAFLGPRFWKWIKIYVCDRHRLACYRMENVTLIMVSRCAWWYFQAGAYTQWIFIEHQIGIRNCKMAKKRIIHSQTLTAWCSVEEWKKNVTAQRKEQAEKPEICDNGAWWRAMTWKYALNYHIKKSMNQYSTIQL